jgi:hypothetical protein
MITWERYNIARRHCFFFYGLCEGTFLYWKG